MNAKTLKNLQPHRFYKVTPSKVLYLQATQVELLGIEEDGTAPHLPILKVALTNGEIKKMSHKWFTNIIADMVSDPSDPNVRCGCEDYPCCGH